MQYVGLERFADEFVSNFSTGTRRITDSLCQLALGALVLLLDEPTAGLADARPRHSARSSAASATSPTPRCCSSSTTWRSSWR